MFSKYLRFGLKAGAIFEDHLCYGEKDLTQFHKRGIEAKQWTPDGPTADSISLVLKDDSKAAEIIEAAWPMFNETLIISMMPHKKLMAAIKPYDAEIKRLELGVVLLTRRIAEIDLSQDDEDWLRHNHVHDDDIPFGKGYDF